MTPPSPPRSLPGTRDLAWDNLGRLDDSMFRMTYGGGNCMYILDLKLVQCQKVVHVYSRTDIDFLLSLV